MVEYQKWTSIVFDVAPADADASEVISWAASEWNRRKSALQDATVREARDHARSRL